MSGERPRVTVVIPAYNEDEQIIHVLDRLFETFYTTKAHGMGIGLAVSRTIIQVHGGRLWAAPNVPQGAIFQFTLPAA